MGQLAQATQGRTLQKANPAGGIQQLLERAWPRIAAVMPKHLSSERLFQLALSTINQTPKLAECDSASILSCVMKCSALGLEPSAVDGLGRAYILPYRNHGQMQANFIIGYKGIIDLARRSGQLRSIHAQAVYMGDEFSSWEDETGQHFRFEQKATVRTKERFTDVFVLAILKDGGTVFERMTKDQVEAIRKRSKASNNGPWVTDYEAMACKTVIRRAAKYLPMSTEVQQAIAADETTPDYSGILSPIIADTAPAEDVAVADGESDSGASVAPDGVDIETGEIIADSGISEPVGEFADEDLPFPGEDA